MRPMARIAYDPNTALVVVDVQRGGPSTGLPTKTEQADLLQAMYGRNGEAPVPVIAPRSPADCFDAAIEAVRDGGSLIDPKIVEVMVEARARVERSPLRELTPRELEVLAALAEGKSNSAIAEGLVLTKRAVEKHINAIFLKLELTHAADSEDVSKRVKAALIYLKEGDLREGAAATREG